MINKFDRIVITYKDICSTKIKFLGNKYNGIGLQIWIRPSKREVVLSVTSKILLERSSELISVKNIHKVHYLIKEKLDITFDEFINGCTRTKLEVTSDLRVRQPHGTVGSMFQLGRLQTEYYGLNKPYRSKGQPTSFWLKKDGLTSSHVDYFSCYVKIVDLLRRDKRENQRFLDALAIEQRERLVEDFQGVVRIETKLHSLEKIRQHFRLPEGKVPNLWDILGSEVPINRNVSSPNLGLVFSRK